MIKNLVLSGGSSKCIVFVGAIKALEELNILSTITTFAGTSGGAILALLLILEYSVEDITNLYTKLNLSDLLDINTKNILHFFDNFGFDNGTKVIQILKVVIRKKTGNENITFKELYSLTQKTFVITGTCVEKECVEYFDYKNTPDMPIFLAIRISMGLPFIFNRVIYNNLSYVDGGLLEYFPVKYFKDMSNTLSLGIKNNSLDTIQLLDSIETYMYKILCGLYRAHQTNLFDYCDTYKNTIMYNIEINGLDDIDIDTKAKIINIGYQQTNVHFKDSIIRQTLDSIINIIITNLK